MNNPYPYSADNKRYYTMNYYFKQTYGHKVAKIPLHAGFTCPNRDGTKSIGGCTFCSGKGSGDSILGFDLDLSYQFKQGLKRMQSKWPDCLGIAYFQSYSNSYAPLARLTKLYDPFFVDPHVLALSIATRPDCLEEGFIRYLEEKTAKKDVWLELGLQSIHESTMEACNRQHTTQDVWNCLHRLSKSPIKTCIHIMNSLPGESKEDMIETARQVAFHHPDAIKIHMLHILKGTPMAKDYPFPLLSLDEYVDTVVKQLEVLAPDCIIERLTGDGLAKDLIAPEWTIKKTIVLNEIDKRMVSLNTWQGKKYLSNR